MAKPKKEKLPAIETDVQLHDTVDEIARLEVRVRSLEAKRDAAIQLVRIEHDKTIEGDKSRLTSLMKLAATYASSHRESLFITGLKSTASALAEFGFRSGTPALKSLNKKWTVEAIMTEPGLSRTDHPAHTAVKINKTFSTSAISGGFADKTSSPSDLLADRRQARSFRLFQGSSGNF